MRVRLPQRYNMNGICAVLMLQQGKFCYNGLKRLPFETTDTEKPGFEVHGHENAV